MACKHDCVCKPFRQAIAHPAQRQGQGKRFASYAPLTQSVMCRGKVNDTATHDCSPPPSSAFSALLKSPWLVVVEASLPIHNHAVLYTIANIEYLDLSQDIVGLSLNIVEQTGQLNSGSPSFYDACYHAIALLNNCDFITADRKHYEKTKALGNIRLLQDMA